MTIYIAICDDNIADRKHLERMLERQKDASLKEKNDVLYIDSFGSEEALMHTPIKYDIFFIDVTSSQSSNGMDIAKKLRKRGIGAPIVLCSSSIIYTSFVNAPENVIFQDKPLNAGQISHLTEVAKEWTKSKTPLLEIRCQKETFFVKYTDLVKASPKAKFLTEIELNNGDYLEMADSFNSLQKMCAPYDCFISCGKYLLNMKYIDSVDGHSFRLTNGDYVKFSIFRQKEIITMLTNYMQSTK